MKEFPQNWLNINLSKIAFIQNGFAFPSKDFVEQGIPLIRQSNLNGVNVSFEKCVFLNESYLISKKSFRILKGDILIGMSGSIGKLCLYNSEEASLQNQRVGKVILYSEKDINQMFLWYSLNHFISQVLKKGKGLGLSNVSAKDIESIKIPLAPYNEQRRIVEKLDKLLAKVESAKARLEKIPLLLKQFRQSVLSAAVSGALTKDWREENPDVESAEELFVRLTQFRHQNYEELCLKAKETNSRKPKLPRGLKESNSFEIGDGDILPLTWLSTIVDAIGDVEIGGTPSRKFEEYWNGTIKWISSGEVANNIIFDTTESITEIGLKNSSVKIYPTGTVLLAMIGEGKTRGQTSILNIPAGTNQNVAGIILNNSFIVSKYIWYLFLENYDKTRSNSVGGNQPALNGLKVGQLNVPLPPYDEQIEIVKRVDALFQTADQVEARYQKAKASVDKLQQSILAKAFRGELVPQDPNDEPASVLLERIRAEKEKLESGKKKDKVKRNG